jgi:hypothetical protein
MCLNSTAGNVPHGLAAIKMKRWQNMCYFNANILPIDEIRPGFSRSRIAQFVCINRSNLARPKERWADQNSRREKKPQMAYVVLLLLIIPIIFKSRHLLLVERGVTLNFSVLPTTVFYFVLFLTVDID